MSELEMKTEAETEDFAGDLSDEALDREGALSLSAPPPSCWQLRALKISG